MSMKPIKLRVLTKGDEAWAYINQKSIDVYCYRKGVPTLSCRIPGAQMKEFLSRLAEKP